MVGNKNKNGGNKSSRPHVGLSSPSGAGKTSICRELLSLEENLEMSISVTRPRRQVKYGVDYSFMGGVQFDKLIKTSALLNMQVFDYYY